MILAIAFGVFRRERSQIGVRLPVQHADLMEELTVGQIAAKERCLDEKTYEIRGEGRGNDL